MFTLKIRFFILTSLIAAVLVYQAQNYHDAVLVKSSATQALNIIGSRLITLEEAWEPLRDPMVSLPSLYIEQRECSRALEETEAAISWYGDYWTTGVYYVSTAVAFSNSVRGVLQPALSGWTRVDGGTLSEKMVRAARTYLRPTWLFVRQECEIREKASGALYQCRSALNEPGLQRIEYVAAVVCRRS